MRKIGGRELALLCAVIGLGASACVTRGVATSPRTLEALRTAVESGPTPRQRLGPSAKQDSETLDYSLNARGRVRCGGFIQKTQTVYFQAWVTQPGLSGERVDVPSLKLSFQYLDGLFAGAEVSGAEAFTEELAIYESIRGVGDICSCVYAVADATLLNSTRVQVKEHICPE